VLISALAAMMTAATPSLAAPDYRETAGATTRHAAFIGAQARLSLGSRKPTLPVARLTAGTTNLGLTNRGTLMSRPIGTTFELGLSRTGRADFFVGGHRYYEMKTKLGIAPVGAALLAVGSLVVGAAVVASGSSGSSGQAPEQKKQQPEVVCLGIGICPTLPPPGK
jgi:hypothetical protein